MYSEIQRSRALQWHGAILALNEPLTAYYSYYQAGNAVFHNFDIFPPICSPVWQSCHLLRDWITFWGGTPELWLQYGLVIMSLLGVLAFALFVWGGSKRVRLAHGIMSLGVIMKIFYLLADFRLDHNAHRMVLWSQLVFLLPIPNKADVLRMLLVMYYFWAGTLKFNKEWLSGAPLMGQQLWPAFVFTPKVVEVSLYYAIFMEIIAVWALLCHVRSWCLVFAFAQVAAFHASSYGVVGYFYPLSMYALLSIIPILSYFGDDDKSRGIVIEHSDSKQGGENKPRKVSLLRDFFSARAATSVYFAFILFSACQIYPHLTMPGDKALTSEGRVMALHMLDARTTCNRQQMTRLAMFVDSINNDREESQTNNNEPIPQIPPIPRGWLPRYRMMCDPFVRLQVIMHQCKHLENKEKFTLNVFMLSKRSTDEDWTIVVKEEDICNRFVLGKWSEEHLQKLNNETLPNDEKPFSYSWWRHNDWILPAITGVETS